MEKGQQGNNMPEINEHDEVVDRLTPVSEARYGASYRADVLAIYQNYVASAETISRRRTVANQFFLTVNTGFLGAVSYIDPGTQGFAWLPAVVGFLFCLTWYGMIHSYRTLNGSKFEVIQYIEVHLPLAPYTAEWIVQKNGPTRHHALTTVEAYVPIIFMVLHVTVGLWLVLDPVSK
jgi:hypothetical protein